MARGLRGEAVVAGFAERRPERHFMGAPLLGLEQWADLTAHALADAGIDPREVDGLCCGGDTPGSQIIGVVELDIGVHMTTTLVGIGPDDVRVGMPVRGVFDTGGDGVTLLRFRPA